MPVESRVSPDQLGPELERMFARIVEQNRAKAVRVLIAAADEAKGVAVQAIHDTKPYAPIDQIDSPTSLVRSYEVTPTPDGAILKNTAPHAAFMEFGTEPHWVPTAPLVAWAERKLRKKFKPKDRMKAALAFAERVQLKIGHHGTAARGFHARASQKFPEIVGRWIRRAFGGS